MITVGISESDAKIKQLAGHFFCQQGLRCGALSSRTEPDFIFCTPESGTHYDILIENKALSSNAPADYIHLLNSDDITDVSGAEQCLFITYGLNRFATVTASSIFEESKHLRFQYCLQRGIVSLKGKQIECQEFPVSIYNSSADLHSALAFATLALIAGIKPEHLGKIVLRDE